MPAPASTPEGRRPRAGRQVLISAVSRRRLRSL